MKQWFYIESGQQRGPVSESGLKQLLETRRIPASTLIWSEGIQEWSPVGNFEEFALSPYAPPATASDPEFDWSQYKPSGPQFRPWVRYWARTLDTLIFGAVLAAVLEFTAPRVLEMPDTLFGITSAALYNLIEPALFAAFGTTPMKALLKVRVRNADGSKLSYSRALRRTINVWIRGEGMGIPVISLVTQITSYSRLNNNRRMSWDADGGFSVTHQEIEWWRWLLLIAAFAGFVSLMAIGTTLQ
jgi:hypothetical protein